MSAGASVVPTLSEALAAGFFRVQRVRRARPQTLPVRGVPSADAATRRLEQKEQSPCPTTA